MLAEKAVKEPAAINEVNNLLKASDPKNKTKPTGIPEKDFRKQGYAEYFKNAALLTARVNEAPKNIAEIKKTTAKFENIIAEKRQQLAAFQAAKGPNRLWQTLKAAPTTIAEKIENRNERLRLQRKAQRMEAESKKASSDFKASLKKIRNDRKYEERDLDPAQAKKLDAYLKRIKVQGTPAVVVALVDENANARKAHDAYIVLDPNTRTYKLFTRKPGFTLREATIRNRRQTEVATRLNALTNANQTRRTSDPTVSRANAGNVLTHFSHGKPKEVLTGVAFVQANVRPNGRLAESPTLVHHRTEAQQLEIMNRNYVPQPQARQNRRVNARNTLTNNVQQATRALNFGAQPTNLGVQGNTQPNAAHGPLFRSTVPTGPKPQLNTTLGNALQQPNQRVTPNAPALTPASFIPSGQTLTPALARTVAQAGTQPPPPPGTVDPNFVNSIW